MADSIEELPEFWRKHAAESPETDRWEIGYNDALESAADDLEKYLNVTGPKTIELSERQRERFDRLREECTVDYLPAPTAHAMIDSLMDEWEYSPDRGAERVEPTEPFRFEPVPGRHVEAEIFQEENHLTEQIERIARENNVPLPDRKKVRITVADVDWGETRTVTMDLDTFDALVRWWL